uniref:Uncharacterized protein n=1 Tax=Caloglossa intermedia TaxID=100879 RepID=A0A1Z1M6M6_9FLOR|nr:hypothetical protein [Caloglossa intermedia]ARW61552.1 hypothetical protein [Caloglossa intermedia]
MNKKTFFIIKIRLLYISLKILYSSSEYKIYEETELQNNLDFINSHVFCNSVNEIRSIFITYKLGQNCIVYGTARSIIETYYDSKKEKKKLKQKYLNKFKYLYYNTLSYYQYGSLNLDYQNIAIFNLYIIIQCYKSKNICTLIKYLYTPFYYKT